MHSTEETQKQKQKGQSLVMVVSSHLSWTRTLRVTLIKCRLVGVVPEGWSLMECVDRQTKHICDDGTVCSVMSKFSAGNEAQKRVVIKNVFNLKL